MFTLDTNILIYFVAGQQQIIRFILDSLKRGTKFFLPTVVVIEFLAYPSLKEQERKFFLSLLSQLQVVPLDFELAVLSARLRRKYNLKLGDAVVAATALFTRTPVVTRNQRDFKKIPGLKIVIV